MGFLSAYYMLLCYMSHGANDYTGELSSYLVIYMYKHGPACMCMNMKTPAARHPLATEQSCSYHYNGFIRQVH